MALVLAHAHRPKTLPKGERLQPAWNIEAHLNGVELSWPRTHTFEASGFGKRRVLGRCPYSVDVGRGVADISALVPKCALLPFWSGLQEARFAPRSLVILDTCYCPEKVRMKSRGSDLVCGFTTGGASAAKNLGIRRGRRQTYPTRPLSFPLSFAIFARSCFSIARVEDIDRPSNACCQDWRFSMVSISVMVASPELQDGSSQDRVILPLMLRPVAGVAISMFK